MKPPYQITHPILKLISSISEKIGEGNANYLVKPSPQLRKQNKIRTIHSSLKIEGNTLSMEQITALIDNKRIIGPEKDILEVLNAIRVYDIIRSFQFNSEKSFLHAHGLMLLGLVSKPGKYRTTSVGVIKGSDLTHLAPSASMVPGLMKDLFCYLRSYEELPLIKSCVFHYEMEFIHPFIDGNGRMGRLWQTVILLKSYPVFEFLPFETLISQKQSDYYNALSLSDKSGESTYFIEFMLGLINESLAEILSFKNRSLKDLDRLSFFVEFGPKEFTRKDYMNVFKDISTATASRDLQKGVELKYFRRAGDFNKTWYWMVN